MVNKIILIILYSIALNSCFDTEIEELRPRYKLVVNGTINYDGIVTCSVSKPAVNGEIVSEKSLYINDANCYIVNLCTNEKTKLKFIGDGNYQVSLDTVESSCKYKIAVSHANLGTAVSDSVSIEEDLNINIDSITYRMEPDNRMEIPIAQVYLNIVIPDSKPVFSIDNDQNAYQNLVSLNPLANQCGLDYLLGITYFSTNCFIQKEISMRIDYKPYFRDRIYLKETKVEIGIITKEILDYVKIANQPTGFDAGFLRPVLNYSNINGGYGVFVAIKSKKFSVKFP